MNLFISEKKNHLKQSCVGYHDGKIRHSVNLYTMSPKEHGVPGKQNQTQGRNLTQGKHGAASSTVERVQSNWPGGGVQSSSYVRLLCDPVDYSPPASSVHGISQARILEWVVITFSRGSSQSRDWTCIPCFSCIGRQILYHWRHLETCVTHRALCQWLDPALWVPSRGLSIAPPVTVARLILKKGDSCGWVHVQFPSLPPGHLVYEPSRG